jgi:hypothetical protein
MLPIESVRNALRERGYTEMRAAQNNDMRLTLMTNRFHVLVLQEYTDGGAELYAPLGQRNDLAYTIAAIPMGHIS